MSRLLPCSSIPKLSFYLTQLVSFSDRQILTGSRAQTTAPLLIDHQAAIGTLAKISGENMISHFPDAN